MSWQFQLLNRPYGGVTEGPVWDGEAIHFTHIPTSRIMRYDLNTGEITPWRSTTNHTNGLAYDLQGRLYGCCSGGRAIVRFDSDGRHTAVIADRVEGKRLNTPNDLAIDRRGRIWFTNPWNAGNIDPSEREELDNRSVVRADPQPDGSYTATRVTFDTTMPNGILVSPDQQTLYVAESNSERLDLDRELRAYPINDDGSLGPYTVLHTFGKDGSHVHRGIDGMCLDAQGNIVACAGWELGGPGPMIYAFSPSGRVIETHPVPANRPTNCCFGGPGMSTLYVTTTQGHFFRAETDRVGWAIYP
ncbi:MAG TPA: SMP-30/gluconolactonase/LRE family protein [Dehalococcoidia bacterium]|nr:SMP-30/gluconolactonase/LRE family protein [Dehalococcoidia bacterium]